MVQKKNKTEIDLMSETWEEEFDENVNYDEAELGCNWSMDDLKEFIRRLRQEAKEEGEKKLMDSIFTRIKSGELELIIKKVDP